MLIVSNIDGSQVEPLTHHQGLKVEEEVNGGFTLSFTSFNMPENPGHESLMEECFIIVEGQEFRVKQLTENQYSKSVVATHTFFDLVDDRRDGIYGGTHTVDEFANFILSGTGWTYSSDVTESVLIENFGNENLITLINAMCAAFQCEYQILPDKHVHFAKQIGPDNDAVYRYKHNVVALEKKVDTTKLKTFIEGYGADGLYVSYTSPNAEMFGIRKAEPIHDDRFTNADSLVEYIKSQLTDEPEVYFELDSAELLNRELGERVWLIYEPMNIEFQTRILKQTREFRNGTLVTTSVALGNTLPKSTEDILVSQKVEIDQNKKQTQSKFEQTNERINMEVEAVNESIAAVEILAENIELSVNNLITNEVASLNLRANSVETSVSNLEADMSAQFTVMAGEVSSKVTAGEAQSIFYQAANSFTFNADQINFVGHVFGQNATFSGDIQTSANVTVGNNIYIGSSSDSSTKQVIFNGVARIVADWYNIALSAPNLDLSQCDYISWGNNAPVAKFG